jgi:DNA-binding transcriptional ArsR family regulator
MPAEIQGSGIAFRYNPQFLSDAELEGIFVGRDRELQELKQNLLDASPEQVPQHIILTGQRGIGKTTLLHRVALEVRKDPALGAHWLALTFPEEQYTVSTLAEFWLNVLDALVDCLGRRGILESEQAELDRAITRLQALSLPEREKQALATIEQFIAVQHKGLLLLVDGTDAVFERLENADPKKDKKGEGTVLWRLRKVLSHHPGIFWLGTSYLPMESEHQYQDAFLDFFHVHELRSFSRDDMYAAMLKLAGIFGMGPGLEKAAAVQKMQETLDRHPERLRSLHALTNGNPRTMIVLYNLFAASDSADIQGDVNNLLDLMTPLYKSRMEALSDQSRKILAHLMDAWNPQTANQLQQASTLPVTTVNSQLSRLEKQGMVEKTTLPDSKRMGYQVSERFFNIWYLMRCSSRRLRNRFIWLIDFMRLWFSPQELSDLARQHRQRLAAGEYGEYGLTNASVVIQALDGNPDYRELTYSRANLSHLQSKLKQPDLAKEYFRQAVSLSSSNPDQQASILLQSHLFLNNQDAALAALETLARQATEENKENSYRAFYHIKEQLRECYGIGLGAALADLMERSAYADFLKPYSLALRVATLGDPRIFKGAAKEVANMAEEVYQKTFGDLSSAQQLPGVS